MSKCLMHFHQIFDVHPTAVNAKICSKQIKAVREGTVVQSEQRKKFSGQIKGMTEVKDKDKRQSGGGRRGVYDDLEEEFLIDKEY